MCAKIRKYRIKLRTNNWNKRLKQWDSEELASSEALQQLLRKQ